MIAVGEAGAECDAPGTVAAVSLRWHIPAHSQLTIEVVARAADFGRLRELLL